MVSILLLYLNFPPCVPLNHCLHSIPLFKLPPLHSTIPWSPAYVFISTSPPARPTKPLSPFDFFVYISAPAFHHTMVSTLLLYFNFPPLRSTIPWSPFYFFISTSPPCVPLYHGLHSTSLFKLTPSLRSTKQWYPFYFLIETSPPTFHQTMVSIPLLSLNFPPCVPLNHCLHSTLYLNFLPLRSTKPLFPFYCFS